MKNTGVMPTAFKKMIARLTGTEGDVEGDPDITDDEAQVSSEAEDEEVDEDEPADEDDGEEEVEESSTDETVNIDEAIDETTVIGWLEAQDLGEYDENCTSKFSITVVEGTGRLFNGHDCGAELNYTLVSQIQLPFGTWGSNFISYYSQEPDGPCEPISDLWEQCEFSLTPDNQRMAIIFDSIFNLS